MSNTEGSEEGRRKGRVPNPAGRGGKLRCETCRLYKRACRVSSPEAEACIPCKKKGLRCSSRDLPKHNSSPRSAAARDMLRVRQATEAPNSQSQTANLSDEQIAVDSPDFCTDWSDEDWRAFDKCVDETQRLSEERLASRIPELSG